MSSPFNEVKYKQLLEGLEISEALFSETIKNKDFRIDSQYYTQAPIKNPILKYKKIGEVIHSSQYGISIEMNEDGHGYPIYRMNELHNMLCDLEVNKYADITQDEYQRFALKNRDVLFNRTNSFEWVGRTGVYYQNDDIERTFASYLVRFNPIESVILSEYLCAFLNSKEGVMDIKRRARQSINQTNVNPEEVKEIEIPVLDMDFQLQIKEHFEKSNSCQLKSLSLYKDAENQLLDELGLKGWQPDNNPVNIKQLKESFLASGRLDAEYYQPKYEDYATFIRKYKGGADTFGNICTLNEKNYNPIDNSEYKYIELSNIGNSGEITGCTTSIGSELPSRARRLVRRNDVIVSSIEGSLQSVALVTDEYDKAICSTGFYVVKSDTINPETLLVLFKSEPMQNLLKQGCSGTILTAIGRNELQNIVMPKIRKEVQSEIATYVQKSISLRNEAKQLLESAKLRVEDAISTPPLSHLIDNQVVINYNKKIEESIYYYRLAKWTLLQELYAEAWVTTSTANCSIKNYSVCKSSDRLDAEYYQPKYDALFAQLSKYECDIIKDIAHIKKSVEPGSEAYQDSGIPFLRVSDVSKFGISEPNIFLSTSDFNLNELRPKKDTILLSKDGSVGIAYKVEEDKDCITSGALLHLSVFNEDYTPDYLTLVLNSIVVQMQAERDSNGAIIQHWKPSEIEQVIIPKLPKPIQETISAKIQESFALKAESKRLLDEAKMMVEREIEKG